MDAFAANHRRLFFDARESQVVQEAMPQLEAQPSRAPGREDEEVDPASQSPDREVLRDVTGRDANVGCGAASLGSLRRPDTTSPTSSPVKAAQRDVTPAPAAAAASGTSAQPAQPAAHAAGGSDRTVIRGLQEDYLHEADVWLAAADRYAQTGDDVLKRECEGQAQDLLCLAADMQQMLDDMAAAGGEAVPISRSVVDLHQLTENAAVGRIVRRYNWLLELKSRASFVLEVITGGGNNSRDGQAKLRPAILALFQANKVACTPQRTATGTNAGAFEVVIPSQQGLAPSPPLIWPVPGYSPPPRPSL
ncbi:hypothetical protein WJX73_001842 [Symbiochloris irregularis]|uniref:Smr domain-containing protein n=1 Tax=Symbiochloris irregularis TaxID=706552 RepID=A0AAW1P5H1_9CHLO